MRRMLDPKEAGGALPSTIQFDKDGNRKVGKDLGVDGKLKLKSLVSESNPDGDITKELGARTLYQHAIAISADSKLYIGFNIYSYQKEKITTSTFSQFIKEELQVNGLFVQNNITYLARILEKSANGTLQVTGINMTDITKGATYTIPSRWYLFDYVQQVQ